MAVREFNGSSDRIVVDDGIIGQLANGALTLLAVVKPTTLNAGEFYLSVQNGSNCVAGLIDNGNTNIVLGDDDDYSFAVVGQTAADWQILAATCTAPATAPKLHRKLVSSGSFTHTTAGANFAGNTIDAAAVEFGSFNNGAFGSFKDMRLAVAAVFNVALSDGQIDGIGTALTTQSIYDLTPQGLWEFNQSDVGTTVTDLMGNGANETLRSGTTVINGDDPPGWTFGLAPPAEAAPFIIPFRVY